MTCPEEVLSSRAISVLRAFSMRAWTLGGTGSLSVLLGKDPFRLLITPDAHDLGNLRANELLTIDSEGKRLTGSSELPSSDWELHMEILRDCGARAIFHTQSVWDLLIAEVNEASGSFHLRDFYALSKLSDGETSVTVPTLPFRADTEEQNRILRERLRSHAPAPAVLISGRGLYCWGRDFEEAKRKTELLALLIETCARARFSIVPPKTRLTLNPANTNSEESLAIQANEPHLRLLRGGG